MTNFSTTNLGQTFCRLKIRDKIACKYIGVKYEGDRQRHIYVQDSCEYFMSEKSSLTLWHTYASPVKLQLEWSGDIKYSKNSMCLN